MENKRIKPVWHRSRQAGATLAEMMIVIGIAALMLGLAVPVANVMLNSFESESGAKSIINGAMASARAIASKEQRYAGIRFQKQYDPNNPDPLKTSQYIIFIVHDPNRTGLADGFRAIDGVQPIKLPDSIGVMDLVVDDLAVTTNSQIDDANEVNDTTTFSIVFSPSGKLVIHDVRTRNRDGCPILYPAPVIDNSMDDVFNTLTMLNSPVTPAGMFIQDDYHNLGYGQESSRSSFAIYDAKILKQIPANLRWTNYLSQLKLIYINPYTGTIINEK
jgi:hypothetical protein